MMHSIVLAHQADWEGWRDAARALALRGIAPGEVLWSVREADDLFAPREAADLGPLPPGAASRMSLPRGLVSLAELAILSNEPQRFAWLYRLIWRASRGEKDVLADPADLDVHRVARLVQSVRRDIHKMRAFVRFREVTEPEGVRHVAWFEPVHYILEANAPFFVRRFATMAWSILTPYRSAHWDGETLRLAAGATRAEVPDDDALAAYWRTYYASIFNPARLKVSAMLSEMPRKYWRNLPEAAAIPELIRNAPAQAAAMVQYPMSEDPTHAPARVRTRAYAEWPVPETPLEEARESIAVCQRCDLFEHATQPVFGEGPRDAGMMLVGEQPGDQEDLAGRPFVGPAGQLLDRALAEAGIDRAEVYVTNAVKHFKFEPRGKRRIHAKPDVKEITACRAWLAIEQREIRPRVLVMMGASAARAVLDRGVTIGRERGQPIRLDGITTGLITVHPSYLLRLPDEEARAREYAAFVADLRAAVRMA
jgi:DNA polymerase